MRSAECQSNSELGTLGKIEPAGQRYVAVKRLVVLPVKTIVVSQVSPAIIHAHVTARGFGERDRRADGQPCVSSTGSQKFVAATLEDVTVVVPTSDFQVRRAQHICLQLL